MSFWIDETNVKDLDETIESWENITEDELNKILDSCEAISESKE